MKNTERFNSRQAAMNKLIQIVGPSMLTTNLKNGELTFESASYAGSLMFNHDNRNNKVWNLRVFKI